MDKKQDKSMEAIAERICKTYDRLVGARGNWENTWDQIAKVVWPSQSRLFSAGGVPIQTQGELRNDEVYDATATHALNKFASILDSWLTPMGSIWSKVVPSDIYLMKDRQTRLWFEELNQVLFKVRYAPRSNFVAQNQLVYKGLGAYGTGSLFIDDLILKKKKAGFRYKNIHLSDIYVQENHQGQIDTVYRRIWMEARQIMQEWQNVPSKVSEAAKNTPEKQFLIIHCVKPRGEEGGYDPARGDYKGMEFASYYVLKDERFVLEDGGFDTFPYACSRYEQVPGEVYGRSPAMDAMPAIRTLQEQKKTILTQGHLAVSPALLAYDDGVMDTLGIKPGFTNWGGVNEDGRPLVHALPVGNIAIGKDLMDDERNDIKEPFLVTLFQILEENPQMTATEVMERVKEKGILTAPTMGRQYSEYHGPMIDREISLAMQQKLMKTPFPQALIEAKGEYRIEYESPMSRMQRAEEASGFMRSVETSITVATQTGNPEPLDHWNWDVIVPEVADINGVPARWRNDPAKIQAIRENRAQQAAAAQETEAAPGNAAMINAATKAATAKRKVA